MSPVARFDPLPTWPTLRDSWWQQLKWTRIGCLFGAHRGCAGDCGCHCHHPELRAAHIAELEAELLDGTEA